MRLALGAREGPLVHLPSDFEGRISRPAPRNGDAQWREPRGKSDPAVRIPDRSPQPDSKSPAVGHVGSRVMPMVWVCDDQFNDAAAYSRPELI